ncbi:helix-turn-helix domain-containing protein [Dehalococcoidia bacterium]|nr:helix-turn-helix domain-containing protein [Dehalococcoidia bacterium]
MSESITSKVARLLGEGMTPKEIMEQGFHRSTVYKVKRKLESEKSQNVSIAKLLEYAQQWGNAKHKTCANNKPGGMCYGDDDIVALFCTFCPHFEIARKESTNVE